MAGRLAGSYERSVNIHSGIQEPDGTVWEREQKPQHAGRPGLKVGTSLMDFQIVPQEREAGKPPTRGDQSPARDGGDAPWSWRTARNPSSSNLVLSACAPHDLDALEPSALHRSTTFQWVRTNAANAAWSAVYMRTRTRTVQGSPILSAVNSWSRVEAALRIGISRELRSHTMIGRACPSIISTSRMAVSCSIPAALSCPTRRPRVSTGSSWREASTPSCNQTGWSPTSR